MGIWRALMLGCALLAPPAHAGVDKHLARAEEVKRTSMAAFDQEIGRVMADLSRLTTVQRDRLDYLLAWRDTFTGDYVAAINEFERLIAQSGDEVVRFRSRVTLLNALTLARRYSEAYEHLTLLVDDVDAMPDRAARDQALGVIAQLLNQGAQYKESLAFSRRLMQEGEQAWARCGAQFLIVEAQARSGDLRDVSPEALQWADRCSTEGEAVFAGLLRAQLARLHLRNNRPEAALAMLAAHAEAMAATRYPSLAIDVETIQAQAYLAQEKYADADAMAASAIAKVAPGVASESLGQAWRVRYLVAKAQGDNAGALSAHEQLLATEMAYANDIGQRALAYQMARYQARANALQIESLNQQNELLTLQQEVASKNTQAARLTIALLLTVLAFGLFWAIRAVRLRRHFQVLAQRDSLTQVANRRYFVEQVTSALEQLQRHQQSAVLILVDLDYFKLINDRYGHAEGDEVLQRAAAALREQVRNGELIGRIGGEEFAILLPRIEADLALQRAESFRRALHTVPYGPADARRSLTASFGIVSSANAGYNLRSLMTKADAALYVAKNAGRDRVEVFRETPIEAPEQALASPASF